MAQGASRCGGLHRDRWHIQLVDTVDGVIDTALVSTLKAYRLFSNETDMAWTDTRDFEKFIDPAGIKHTCDFTSYSIGGHTFSYYNAVFKKYAVELFK